jgi:putative transposase
MSFAGALIMIIGGIIKQCINILTLQVAYSSVGCIEDAKTFCRSFFDWYNQDHPHAGIGLMPPDQVSYGQADEVHAARQKTFGRAFQPKPERCVKKPPEPPLKPTAAGINPPSQRSVAALPGGMAG